MSSQNEPECPLNDCDGTGHTSGAFNYHRSIFYCPRIAAIMNDRTYKCPVPGCDGKGSSKSIYSTHRQVHRCPLIRVKMEQYRGLLTISQFEDILSGKCAFPYIHDSSANSESSQSSDEPMDLSVMKKPANSAVDIKVQSRKTNKATTKPTVINRRNSPSKQKKQKTRKYSPKKHPEEPSHEFLQIISNCQLEPFNIEQQLQILVQRMESQKKNLEISKYQLETKENDLKEEVVAAKVQRNKLVAKCDNFLQICQRIDLLNCSNESFTSADELSNTYLKRIDDIFTTRNKSLNDSLQFDILRNEFKENWFEN